MNIIIKKSPRGDFFVFNNIFNMIGDKVIMVFWKISGRIDMFHKLSRIYDVYPNNEVGTSIHSLYRKNLEEGYENDTVVIRKYKFR